MPVLIKTTKEYIDAAGHITKTIVTTAEVDQDIKEGVLKFLSGMMSNP